jgi:RNA polymerase sigma factor (TIGR02999 family)
VVDAAQGRGDVIGGEVPGGEVTRLLAEARAGDRAAADRLFALVYDDLHRLAARHARSGDARAHRTTSLVHEVYLRLDRDGRLPYNDRTHFFAVASRAMRQIVIDDARSRLTRKRGQGVVDRSLDDIGEGLVGAAPQPLAVEELLALDGALGRLEAAAPELARTVEWHFFGGMTFGEIARAQEVSERTVMRHWRTARAFLQGELTDPTP